MNILTRLLLIACLALPLAACKKEEVAAPAEKPPVAVPANEDPNAWQEYATDVIRRNMDGVNASPYVYFLPGESTQDFQGEYDRLLEKLQGDLARGILEGNMLAFVSPTSGKMADLVIAAFGKVDGGSLKGVKVLFIGNAADNARVEAAVTPSGANYKFVEAR